MKRFFSALLCLTMVFTMLVGCSGGSKPAEDSGSAVTPPASDVAMQYISVEDAAKVLEDDNYIFFDVRKAADHETSHVTGSESHDMDAAKNGDFQAGVAVMQNATKNLDKNIVVVCYSGKSYAQATFNVLSALGYDMSKVYTLEGGYSAWSEAKPELIELGEKITEPASDVAMQYITVDEAAKVLSDENYVFFDVRKDADFQTATVPGAVGHDMDAAKEGDFKAGVATMQVATRGLDKNIVIVCYSGKSYAQATTNVLSALGYDMSKVYTLEGGFKAWSEANPAAPELSGTMKVVATSEAYVDLFSKFTEETGVKVELLSMSSGEVLSKLRAEGGTPSADLWFGGGIDAFMSAKADGLLEQVKFDAMSDMNPAFIDSEGYWFSKGITIVGFLVNNPIAQELNLEIPQSWQDLLDEQYKGEIIMSNPAVSGTNYAVVNSLLQAMGEEEGWAYFEDLNENIAYYSRRGADPKNKVTADEFAVGITYLDRTIDALLNDYDVTIVYPTDGMPWVPEGVAAFKNAENTAAAVYFIEWLFSSDDNMRMLAEIDQKDGIKSIVPSLEGVELSYDTSLLLDLDLSKFGSQREAILARFEALMGDKAVAE